MNTLKRHELARKPSGRNRTRYSTSMVRIVNARTSATRATSILAQGLWKTMRPKSTRKITDESTNMPHRSRPGKVRALIGPSSDTLIWAGIKTSIEVEKTMKSIAPTISGYIVIFVSACFLSHPSIWSNRPNGNFIRTSFLRMGACLGHAPTEQRNQRQRLASTISFTLAMCLS